VHYKIFPITLYTKYALLIPCWLSLGTNLNTTEVKLSHFLNNVSTMLWTHTGEWRYSSTILDLCTRWRWVVSFYPQEKGPWYSLDRRLCGPRVNLDTTEKRKNLARQDWNPSCPACSPQLYQLSYPDSYFNIMWPPLSESKGGIGVGTHLTSRYTTGKLAYSKMRQMGHVPNMGRRKTAINY
jgi:hypothetical protein